MLGVETKMKQGRGSPVWELMQTIVYCYFQAEWSYLSAQAPESLSVITCCLVWQQSATVPVGSLLNAEGLREANRFGQINHRYLMGFALLISAHNLPAKTLDIIQAFIHFTDEVHMDNYTSNNDAEIDHIDSQVYCLQLWKSMK